MTGDELDRVLDDALTSYSLQEPRAGLSGRVMARVTAEGAPARSGWLYFLFAAAAAACLVIAWVNWPVEKHAPQLVTVAPMIAQPQVERAKITPREEVAREVRAPVIGNVRQQPRLFPSPTPLTGEERALMALARQTPEVAQWLQQPDKPLAIEPINITPIQVDGLETGESK